jgi:hypothetical protein
MTMHILPAYYTTTKTSSRKAKSKPPTKHDAWLMKKGLHPDQIKLKKGVDKNWKKAYTESMMVDRSDYVSSGFGNGRTSKPAQKVYSGERKLLGIATMHKSNMVPVFAKQDAEDIARMRRG